MVSRPRPLASFITTTGPNGEKMTRQIDVDANDDMGEKSFGPGDIPAADERVTLVEALRGFFRELSQDEDAFDRVRTFDDTCSECREDKEVHECEACKSLFCAECVGQNGFDPKTDQPVKIKLPSARTKKTTKEWLWSHDPNCPSCTHPWI